MLVGTYISGSASSRRWPGQPGSPAMEHHSKRITLHDELDEVAEPLIVRSLA